MRILLAEDDSYLSDGVAASLRYSGYSVDQARTGNEADRDLASTNYDLVLLDLGLPELDGTEVIKRSRARGQTVPILVLSVRNSIEERVAVLDFGANDYLSKPFSLAELLARVRALLRNDQWKNNVEVTVGAIRYNTGTRRLFINDEPVELTARELAIFEILLQGIGGIVSKQRILERLSTWDTDISPNALEISMHRLRKKLGDTDCIIRTLRGLGYMMEGKE